MRIDIHGHVFADPRLISPLNGTPFMSAEQQLEVMARKGIDMTVILPLTSAEAPAETDSGAEPSAVEEENTKES